MQRAFQLTVTPTKFDSLSETTLNVQAVKILTYPFFKTVRAKTFAPKFFAANKIFFHMSYCRRLNSNFKSRSSRSTRMINLASIDVIPRSGEVKEDFFTYNVELCCDATFTDCLCKRFRHIRLMKKYVGVHVRVCAECTATPVTGHLV